MQSPRIDELRTGGPDAVDYFWRAVRATGTPLIEPVDDETVLVTFLWRGDAEVTVVGWGIDLEMARLPGTDLWFGSIALPARLRTVYFISHAGRNPAQVPPDATGTGPNHVDPLNPRRVHWPRDPADPTDRDTWASALELPRAPAERWSVERPGVPRGSIVEALVPSAAFGADRRVGVYRPAGVDGAGDRAAVVVFDGHLGRTMMRIPTTLDNLIAAGRIPPTVALLLHGTDERREDELAPSSPATTEFVARELMPWARRQHGVTAYRERVCLAGFSMGGLAAATIALRAADVFGGVIAHSASFWWPRPADGEPEWLIREYAHRPRADLRFYLDVGDRETAIVEPGVAPQVEVNRRMRDTLRAVGYPVTYVEYPGGHDYVNWRNTFADGLIAVLGAG